MLNPTSMKINKIESSIMETGKIVDQVLTLDQDYPDLNQLLSGSSSESYVNPIINDEKEFIKTNELKLPGPIQERVATVQCRTFIGLLPEIGRAWLSVDNQVYIWNLSDETDIIEYIDQDQVIITVALVKPKPNVFGDHVKNLLIVSTPLQIIILAVAFDVTQQQPVQLFATQMSLPCDDVLMQSIKGTDDGRIFMIGNDGGLYELDYTSPHKWGKRSEVISRSESYLNKYIPTFTPTFLRPSKSPNVKSIVIDDERKMLYILYVNSSIEAVYLGHPYNNYKTVAKHTTVIENAIQMSRQQSRYLDQKQLQVHSLHIISAAESKKIHLMAITVGGHRLYFSHFQDGFRGTNLATEPNALELGYIRLPAVEGRIYEETYYDCGVCFSITADEDGKEQLETTSLTHTKPTPSFPTQMTISNVNRLAYIETRTNFGIEGHMYGLTEAKGEEKGRRYLKDVAQQLSDPPRQFMTITGFKIYCYQKARPVDTLYRILEEGAKPELIKSFFERYGEKESCAMCLSIICYSDEQEIVTQGTRVFFEYGGVPTATYSSQVAGNHLGRVMGASNMNFSGKHDGFALYLSRVLSSVWKMKVFSQRGYDIEAQLKHNKTQKALNNTKTNLLQLKKFMDLNPQFHDSANISDPRFQATDRNTIQLELSEQKSVHDLYLFLLQCIQTIAFFELMLDSDVQSIIKDYQESTKVEIQQCDMNFVLTTPRGKELMRDTIIGSICKYGATASRSGFNIVTRQLEIVCPTYFLPNDLNFFKGIEYVRRAMVEESDYEKGQSLKASLDHFKAAASDISDEKMKSICETYIRFSFHIGVVELGLERAERIDPQHQAIGIFENNEVHDAQKRELLHQRLFAYTYLFQALNDVLSIREKGVLPHDRRPIADLNQYQQHLLNTALQSKDKLFHFQLYDWFLKRDSIEELLSVDTDYLIPYLETYVRNKRASLEFLWKYYRLKGRYVDTARCLEELATIKDLSIEDRIRYLARAVINIQCRNTNNDGLSAYAQDLEKRLEWAQVQYRIRQILSSIEGPEAARAVISLDERLFTLDELKLEFKMFSQLAHVF